MKLAAEAAKKCLFLSNSSLSPFSVDSLREVLFPDPIIVVKGSGLTLPCACQAWVVCLQTPPAKKKKNPEVACTTLDRKDQEWGQMTSQKKISAASKRKGISVASYNHRTHEQMAKHFSEQEQHCRQKEWQALKKVLV